VTTTDSTRDETWTASYFTIFQMAITGMLALFQVFNWYLIEADARRYIRAGHSVAQQANLTLHAEGVVCSIIVVLALLGGFMAATDPLLRSVTRQTVRLSLLSVAVLAAVPLLRLAMTVGDPYAAVYRAVWLPMLLNTGIYGLYVLIAVMQYRRPQTAPIPQTS
jgi:hypothetical protein